jgi:hypothetical protein
MNDSRHTAKLLSWNARSIGLPANDRIHVQGKIGVVHSIFRRVINITALENRLITVVGQEVGQGPLNILVDIPGSLDLLTIGINKGDTVSQVDDTIVIGENVLVISTQSAELWRPNRNFQTNLQSIRHIITNIEYLSDFALNFGHLNGLGELIPFTHIHGLKDSETKKLGLVSQIALPHISSLLKAIKSSHTQEIKRNIESLVGLGPGLTPAGDDMLLGLMVSMLYLSENFKEKSIDVKKINEDIISVISGKTTTISEEFLREASVGNANEAVASLMECLLTSKSGELENSIRKVLNVGGTSGTDTVFGVILGSYLMLAEKIQQYPRK